MKIKKLKIDNYKCLKNFSLENETNCLIVLGENGSGKSTIFEVIVRIFASFDGNRYQTITDFDYYICYECNEHEIEIKYDYQKNEYDIKIDGEKTSLYKLKGYSKKDVESRNYSPYLPQRILFYNSSKYNSAIDDLLNGLDISYNRKETRRINRANKDEINFDFDNLSRRFYTIEKDSVDIILFALLAGSRSEESQLIREYLKINEEIELVFYDENISNQNSDEHSMLANYEMLNVINDKVANIILSSLNQSYEIPFQYRVKGNEFREIQKDELFYCVNFFKRKNRSLVKVLLNQEGEKFDVNFLSDGEKQLIAIVGLISLFNQRDSLIILDEPDTHLNAVWKYGYMTLLKNILNLSTNSQAMIATHDPLMINGVDKENILLLNKESGKVLTKEPFTDTEGLGIDGILQSEYYGLKTSYDQATSEKFDKRAMLFSKLINNKATLEEKKELTELANELSGLPVMQSSIDFLYDDFMQEFRKLPEYNKEYLSYDEVKKRREDIGKIIKRLYDRKGDK